MKALVDDPDRPVLATPEEAAALIEDLTRVRAATIRPVAWRLCTGVLPVGSAPITAGTVPIITAKAMLATLNEQRSLTVAGMLGQKLAGELSQEASMVTHADVVSGMLDPALSCGIEGLTIGLQTLPGPHRARLIGQLTWCVPTGTPVEAPARSGPDLTRPQSQVSLDKGKDKDTVSLTTPPPELIQGTRLIMRLERWWRWDQPLDVWLADGQALVLEAPGSLAGTTAVAILLPESP